MKRILSLVLSTLLLLSLTTGLTALAETAPELYEIEIMTTDDAFTYSDETPIGQYIKDRFGIVFKNIYYSGDMREKQALSLAAGDYGEIMGLQRNDMVANYINAGVLLSLEPYLEKMPNFTAEFGELIDIWRAVGNGTLYKWEAHVPGAKFESCEIMVRSDILELVDWKAPDTVSEYIDLLKKAKQAHPTTPDGLPTVGLTVPFAESWGLQGVAGIMYEKGDHLPSLGNEGWIFDTALDQFVDYFQNEEFKQGIQFFNTLYREGLLDTECFTDLSAQTLEKMQTGQALSVWYINWQNSSANEALIEAGLDDLQYVQLYIQSDEQAAAGMKRAFKLESSRPYDSWALTDKCRYPERVCELLDWGASEEGQHFLQEGPEGDLWIYNEEGVRVPTEKRLNMTTTEAKAYGIESFAWLMRRTNYMLDGQFFDLMDEQKYVDQFVLTERQREVYDKIGWEASNQWALDNGAFIETGIAQSINIDPTTDLGKVHQKMVETRVKWSAKLILAETQEQFDQIYLDAMAEYGLLDHQAVVDEMNRLYAAAKA